jgi:DNA cross-link repair 1C protein
MACLIEISQVASTLSGHYEKPAGYVANLLLQIHVDDYKRRLYSSLVVKDPVNQFSTQYHMAPEAPGLSGFQCANSRHPGCLTANENVRLHSCEKGSYCQTVKDSSKVVWIHPIICRRRDGQDVTEVGIGGGGDDLDDPEAKAELDAKSAAEVMAFLEG